MPTRFQLKDSARLLAPHLDKALAEAHGERIGFVVFLFDFGSDGSLAYISNAQRPDMIKAVEEWLARQKSGLESDPLGPRAEG